MKEENGEKKYTFEEVANRFNLYDDDGNVGNAINANIVTVLGQSPITADDLLTADDLVSTADLIPQSDIDKIGSDVITVMSDTGNIYSDTTIITSDLKIVDANVKATQEQVDLFDFDSAGNLSNTINANVVTVLGNDPITSDDLVPQSDINKIGSDVVVIKSDTGIISSDLIIVKSDVDDIKAQTDQFDFVDSAGTLGNIINANIVTVLGGPPISVDDLVPQSDVNKIGSDVITIKSDASEIKEQTDMLDFDSAGQLLVYTTNSTGGGGGTGDATLANQEIIKSDMVVMQADIDSIQEQTDMLDYDTAGQLLTYSVNASEGGGDATLANQVIILSDLVVIDANVNTINTATVNIYSDTTAMSSDVSVPGPEM